MRSDRQISTQTVPAGLRLCDLLPQILGALTKGQQPVVKVGEIPAGGLLAEVTGAFRRKLQIPPAALPRFSQSSTVPTGDARSDKALASHLAKRFKDRTGGNPQNSSERRIKLEDDEDRTRCSERAENKGHDYSGARRGE